jgi:acyl dehydratase
MAEPDAGAAGEPLYLDDFHVGRRFASATHLIDTAQIKAFARQFDPQPFHLDEEAVTMRLLVESGMPVAGGLIGMGGEMSWPRPTRPGDVLHVVSEIKEVTPSRSRADRGTVRMHSETRNQRDEVVQILDAKLLVPRRATKSAD